MLKVCALFACVLFCPDVLAQNPAANPVRPTGSLELKTYPVPAGKAGVIARKLQGVYKATSCLRIEAVGDGAIMVYAGPVQQCVVAKAIAGSLERPTPQQVRQKRPPEGISLVSARAEQSLRISRLLATQQAKKPGKNGGDDRPGRADVPVNLAAFGNKLIVTSADPEALALVHKLAHILTQTQGGEGDFQFVRLKYAHAYQAAQELDEMFNGPLPTPQGGKASHSEGRKALGEARPERVRIVADPETDVLLIKASPLDLLTIQSLIRTTIDTADNDASALVGTWTIGLKNASAQAISRIIDDLYGESLSNKAVVTAAGGVAGVGVFAARGRAGSGGPLAISVDDQTNTLVVHCSREMYEEIHGLVADLDKAAADSGHAVKVISLKGVDPQLVQQAIDALQGRHAVPGGRNGTSAGR